MDEDTPSKSARKREATDVQKLGEALLDFTDEELDRIVPDGRLRGALTELRRLTTKEARRRQSQFIGKLMRTADLEPLRAAVEARRAKDLRESSLFKDAQRWRERVIADDAHLNAWLAKYPASDTPDFRALVRDARRELQNSEKRAARELFRTIAATLSA
jgi:ribosome-associated protein